MKSKQHRPGLAWPLIGSCVLALAPAALPAADADAAAILECQAIEDNAERLACYDEALAPKSGSVAPAAEKPAAAAAPAATVPVVEPAQDSVPAPSPAAAVEPERLSDEIGREALKGPEGEPDITVRGRVVECRKNARKRYLFYFDNGQIWQQKDDRRLGWDDCSFEVTISKDFFGYSMVPDGEKRKIRITRIR